MVGRSPTAWEIAVSVEAGEIDVSGLESHIWAFDQVLRARLDGYARRLQIEISRRVRENIDDQGPPFGEKSSSSRVGNQSGRLRDALDMGKPGNIFESVVTLSGLQLTTGIDSKLVPYATAHEYGAEIVPKSAKALTIPISEAAVKALAEVGGNIRQLDLFIIKGDGTNPILARKKGDGIEAMFLLSKKVTLDPRPFWGPGIAEFVRSDLTRFTADFITDAADIWNAS